MIATDWSRPYTPAPGDQWSDDQPSLLDVAPLAAEGDAWWTSQAMAAVKVLAATGREFTVYDITLEPFRVAEPPHANYWGSLTAAAKAAGLIRVAGYLPSPRPSRNGGVCRSWVGLPQAA